MGRAERVIFLIHGIAVLAAVVVLVAAPGLIPGTAGIAMEPDEYLLSYLLAAAELGIAVLSLGATRVRDRGAVRLVAASFAAFHGATAILETAYLVAQGASPVLVANILVRVAVAAVFLVLARPRRS